MKTRARLDAARLADEGRGAPHVRGVGRVAGEPQRDVRLDRGREVAGPAEVGRPRAVRAAGGSGSSVAVAAVVAAVVEAEVVAQEQVLGVDRHVGLELALPPAVGMLQREQVRRSRARALAWAASTGRSAVTRHRASAPPSSLASRRCCSPRSSASARRRRQAAADGALHRRGPAGVGPRAGEVEPRDGRPRPGPQRACPGRGAERRPRLVRDREVEHLRAARGRQQALERRHVAVAQLGDRGADLVDRVRERDRDQLALARLPRPRCGRRATAPASRARPRAARRARAGRSGRGG